MLAEEAALLALLPVPRQSHKRLVDHHQASRVGQPPEARPLGERSEGSGRAEKQSEGISPEPRPEERPGRRASEPPSEMAKVVDVRSGREPERRVERTDLPGGDQRQSVAIRGNQTRSEVIAIGSKWEGLGRIF